MAMSLIVLETPGHLHVNWSCWQLNIVGLSTMFGVQGAGGSIILLSGWESAFNSDCRQLAGTSERNIMAQVHAYSGQSNQTSRRQPQDAAHSVAQASAPAVGMADAHAVLSASAHILPVKKARENLHLHAKPHVPLADRIHAASVAVSTLLARRKALGDGLREKQRGAPGRRLYVRLPEPNRRKAHWDFFLEESLWGAVDMATERRWRGQVTAVLAKEAAVAGRLRLRRLVKALQAEAATIAASGAGDTATSAASGGSANAAADTEESASRRAVAREASRGITAAWRAAGVLARSGAGGALAVMRTGASAEGRTSSLHQQAGETGSAVSRGSSSEDGDEDGDAEAGEGEEADEEADESASRGRMLRLLGSAPARLFDGDATREGPDPVSWLRTSSALCDAEERARRLEAEDEAEAAAFRGSSATSSPLAMAPATAASSSAASVSLSVDMAAAVGIAKPRPTAKAVLEQAVTAVHRLAATVGEAIMGSQQHPHLPPPASRMAMPLNPTDGRRLRPAEPPRSASESATRLAIAFATDAAAALPAPVRARMRPYQLTALRWLHALSLARTAHGHAPGAVLADDRGLGKRLVVLGAFALQAERARRERQIASDAESLTLVSSIKSEAGEADSGPAALGPYRHPQADATGTSELEPPPKAPTPPRAEPKRVLSGWTGLGHGRAMLVVCPPSLVWRWASEAARWFPGARVLVLGQAQVAVRVLRGSDVVLATPAAVRAAVDTPARAPLPDGTNMRTHLWTQVVADLTLGDATNPGVTLALGGASVPPASKILNHMESLVPEAAAGRARAQTARASFLSGGTAQEVAGAPPPAPSGDWRLPWAALCRIPSVRRLVVTNRLLAVSLLPAMQMARFVLGLALPSPAAVVAWAGSDGMPRKVSAAAMTRLTGSPPAPDGSTSSASSPAVGTHGAASADGATEPARRSGNASSSLLADAEAEDAAAVERMSDEDGPRLRDAVLPMCLRRQIKDAGIGAQLPSVRASVIACEPTRLQRAARDHTLSSNAAAAAISSSALLDGSAAPLLCLLAKLHAIAQHAKALPGRASADAGALALPTGPAVPGAVGGHTWWQGTDGDIALSAAAALGDRGAVGATPLHSVLAEAPRSHTVAAYGGSTGWGVDRARSSTGGVSAAVCRASFAGCTSGWANADGENVAVAVRVAARLFRTCLDEAVPAVQACASLSMPLCVSWGKSSGRSGHGKAANDAKTANLASVSSSSPSSFSLVAAAKGTGTVRDWSGIDVHPATATDGLRHLLAGATSQLREQERCWAADGGLPSIIEVLRAAAVRRPARAAENGPLSVQGGSPAAVALGRWQWLRHQMPCHSLAAAVRVARGIVASPHFPAGTGEAAPGLWASAGWRLRGRSARLGRTPTVGPSRLRTVRFTPGQPASILPATCPSSVAPDRTLICAVPASLWPDFAPLLLASHDSKPWTMTNTRSFPHWPSTLRSKSDPASAAPVSAARAVHPFPLSHALHALPKALARPSGLDIALPAALRAAMESGDPLSPALALCGPLGTLQASQLTSRPASCTAPALAAASSKLATLRHLIAEAESVGQRVLLLASTEHAADAAAAMCTASGRPALRLDARPHPGLPPSSDDPAAPWLPPALRALGACGGSGSVLDSFAVGRFNADPSVSLGLACVTGVYDAPKQTTLSQSNGGLDSHTDDMVGGGGWSTVGARPAPGDSTASLPLPYGADVVVLVDVFIDPRAAIALRELLARLAVSAGGGAGMTVVQLATRSTLEEGLLRAAARALRVAAGQPGQTGQAVTSGAAEWSGSGVPDSPIDAITRGLGLSLFGLSASLLRNIDVRALAIGDLKAPSVGASSAAALAAVSLGSNGSGAGREVASLASVTAADYHSALAAAFGPGRAVTPTDILQALAQDVDVPAIAASPQDWLSALLSHAQLPQRAAQAHPGSSASSSSSSSSATSALPKKGRSRRAPRRARAPKSAPPPQAPARAPASASRLPGTGSALTPEAGVHWLLPSPPPASGAGAVPPTRIGMAARQLLLLLSRPATSATLVASMCRRARARRGAAALIDLGPLAIVQETGAVLPSRVPPAVAFLRRAPSSVVPRAIEAPMPSIGHGTAWPVADLPLSYPQHAAAAGAPGAVAASAVEALAWEQSTAGALHFSAAMGPPDPSNGTIFAAPATMNDVTSAAALRMLLSHQEHQALSRQNNVVGSSATGALSVTDAARRGAVARLRSKRARTGEALSRPDGLHTAGNIGEERLVGHIIADANAVKSAAALQAANARAGSVLNPVAAQQAADEARMWVIDAARARALAAGASPDAINVAQAHAKNAEVAMSSREASVRAARAAVEARAAAGTRAAMIAMEVAGRRSGRQLAPAASGATVAGHTRLVPGLEWTAAGGSVNPMAVEAAVVAQAEDRSAQAPRGVVSQGSEAAPAASCNRAARRRDIEAAGSAEGTEDDVAVDGELEGYEMAIESDRRLAPRGLGRGTMGAISFMRSRLRQRAREGRDAISHPLAPLVIAPPPPPASNGRADSSWHQWEDRLLTRLRHEQGAHWDLVRDVLAGHPESKSQAIARSNRQCYDRHRRTTLAAGDRYDTGTLVRWAQDSAPLTGAAYRQSGSAGEGVAAPGAWMAPQAVRDWRGGGAALVPEPTGPARPAELTSERRPPRTTTSDPLASSSSSMVPPASSSSSTSSLSGNVGTGIAPVWEIASVAEGERAARLPRAEAEGWKGPGALPSALPTQWHRWDAAVLDLLRSHLAHADTEAEATLHAPRPWLPPESSMGNLKTPADSLLRRVQAALSQRPVAKITSLRLGEPRLRLPHATQQALAPLLPRPPAAPGQPQPPMDDAARAAATLASTGQAVLPMGSVMMPSVALLEAGLEPGAHLSRRKTAYYRDTAPYVMRYNARAQASRQMQRSQVAADMAQATAAAPGKSAGGATTGKTGSRKRANSGKGQGKGGPSSKRAAPAAQSLPPPEGVAEPLPPPDAQGADADVEASAMEAALAQYHQQPAEVQEQINSVINDATLTEEEKVERIQAFFPETSAPLPSPAGKKGPRGKRGKTAKRR